MEKIRFASQFLLGMYVLFSPPIGDTAIHDLVLELRALVDNSYRGPARYVVDSTIKQAGKKIERSDETEVLFDRNKFRLTSTYVILDFEKLERKPSTAIVLDGKQAFLVAKNADAMSYQMLAINPIRHLLGKISVPDSTVGMGMHDECMSAVGDWFSCWILKHALSGKKGFTILELHKADAHFKGKLKCDASVLSSAGYGEELVFSFVVDSRGLIENWEHSYSSEFPDSRLVTDISWDGEGNFVGLKQQLVDGTRLVTTWESTVKSYSRAPIESHEFSIEHFGLKSESPTIPVVWIFAGAIAVCCVVFWLRRK